MVVLTFYPCNVAAQSTANKDTHGKYYTDLFDYGIMGVGNRSIDQAAVLARAIASTPDGGEIVCRAGTVMYVSGITMVHRRALRFATAGYGYASGGPCQVIYIGATGGMLLNLDSDYDIVFDGWTFWGGDAAYTVSINKNTSCASGGLNSSHNTFKNGGIGGRSVLVGIGISTSGLDCQQNSEFMHFENMAFNGYKDSTGVRHGIGVQLAHANVKGITLERNAISQLHVWVDNSLNGGGSFKTRDTRGGDTDIYYNGSGAENTIVDGDNFEQGCQVLVSGAGGSAGGYWRFMGGRYNIFDSGCGNSSKPTFEVNVQGILEVDYPTSLNGTSLYFGGTGAYASLLILHGNQNGGTSLTGLQVTNPHAIGLDNFGNSVWLAGGQTRVAGNSWGSTNKGFGTWTQYGMPMLGFGVRQNSQLDPGTHLYGQCSDWNDGDLCPPRDSLWIGNQHVVFTGMWPIPFYSQSCTYTGTAGRTTWYVRVFPKDTNGKRSGEYPDGALGTSCTGAASTLSSSNYLTVTWPRVQGAVSYDVVAVGSITKGVLRSTVSDPGSGSSVSYKITSGTSTDRPNYIFPVFWESAITSFYGEAVNFKYGVPLTCYSDDGSTNTACPLNSSINFASGKGIQYGGLAAQAVLVASLATTARTSDNVSIKGATASSHCSLTATNASAATNIATTYISSKTLNQITVTHTGISGMTYDILCTIN